jgi:uncharacterized membrane protein
MRYISKILHPISNVEEVVVLICHDLNVKVTKTTLSHKLLSHPDYPSLKALNDVLSNYNVESMALKIDRLQNLGEVSEGFLIQVKPQNGIDLFAYVFSLTGENAVWYNPATHCRESISRYKLEEQFTGYVMFFDATDKKEEKDYALLHRKELWNSLTEHILVLFLPILAVVSWAVSALTINKSLFWFPFLYSILLFIGCIIGVSLLFYEYNEYNPILSRVCGISQKTSCRAILHSPASKIVGIPWSVVGTAYFVGILIALIFSGYNDYILYPAALLHLLTLPYVFYSLYYQYFVAKQWCPLCLGALLVIVLLFTTALLSGIYYQYPTLTLYGIISLITALFVAFTAIYFLWKLSNYIKSSRYFEYTLSHLKYNTDVFSALLHNSRRIDMPTDDYGIVLGNPHGSIHIVKVCNPYCSHCADAQPILQKLIDMNSEVKLQVIFATDPHASFYKETPIDQFLSLYHQGADMETIMSDWYANPNKDRLAFEQKYPFKQEDTVWNMKNAEKMKQFCEDTNIKGTPTIFINGYELPHNYQVKDLLYILSDERKQN